MNRNKTTKPSAVSREISKFPWSAACCIGLLALLAHAPGFLNGFIAAYDDDMYVLQNSAVQGGLSVRGLVYAFTKTCAGNWHPLTMLSHMADTTFFGLWAPGHHAVSILFHACNSVLLLLLLYAMTGPDGRSAAVACLFAVHPIHVESVAHVSQRKDVLCGFFFLLCLLAYVSYARTDSRRKYAQVILFTILAVLSKPVAVTLPFVLLLLDYWPLGRLGNRAEWKRACVEKLPILAIVAVLSVVTFLVQRSSGAVQSMDFFPMSLRFSNAALAYPAYIGKTLWAIGLSPFYAMPFTIAIWKTVLAVAFLLAVTVVAIAGRRAYPWLIIGWLWFLGTLFPMIGIVQVGSQSLADRYAYITFIGLYIVLVWGVSEVLVRFIPGLRIAAAAIVVLCLMPLTMMQTAYWRDADTLWNRALELDPVNHKAHGNLSMLRIAEGDYEAALAHQLETVKTFPSSSYYDNLGVTYFRLGRIPEAIATFQRALQTGPSNVSASFHLGVAYCAGKQPDEAEMTFDNIGGKTAGFYMSTAEVFLGYGYADRAMKRLEEAKRMDPALPGLAQAFERARTSKSNPVN